MIGMVLVTHGRLAEELRSAMEHVVGVTAERRHGLHRPRRRHGKAPRRHRSLYRERCDTGDGVVLLTDMFGGTPSNLAISMMERKGWRSSPASTCRCWSSSPRCAAASPWPTPSIARKIAGKKYIAAASHVLQAAGPERVNGANGHDTNGHGCNDHGCG